VAVLAGAAALGSVTAFADDATAAGAEAVAGAEAAASSARWTSPMVWNRSAGSLRSVRSMAAASAGLMPGTLPSSGGGGRFICMSKSSPIPSDMNGSSPAVI